MELNVAALHFMKSDKISVQQKAVPAVRWEYCFFLGLCISLRSYAHLALQKPQFSPVNEPVDALMQRVDVL